MENLLVGRVMVASLRAWKRDFFYLTILAAIVETPIVLVELAFHVTPGLDFETGSGTGSARLLTIGFPTLIYGVLAHHFLSGVMESVEGAERHGHPRPTLRELARTLPWLRLFIADLVVNFLMVVGFFVFGVGLLIAGAYLAAVLPLTNMERQSIGPTIKRSIAITRGHFWRVLALWLITSVIVDGAQEYASDFLTHLSHNRVWEFVSHLGADVLFLPMQALPIVMMTFDLVALHRVRQAAAAGAVDDPAGDPADDPAGGPAGGPAAGPAEVTD